MATQYTAGLTAGQVLTAATLNTIGAATEAYTPAWTSTGAAPAINNGTLTGRYWRLQRLIIAQINWVAGGTTAFGTGAYRMSLPITSDSSAFLYGYAVFSDASTFNAYVMVAGQISNTTVQFTWNVGGINGLWAQTTPVPMAATDSMQATLIYQSA